MSCAAKTNNRENPRNNSTEHLRTIVRTDQYSPFREFLRRVKKRCKENRNKQYNITLEDIKSQWELQKGICSYSGVKLILPCESKKHNTIYLASLDRIDSSKGYTTDNIQFVSAAVNFMKHSLNHKEMVTLCSFISNRYISNFLED